MRLVSIGIALLLISCGSGTDSANQSSSDTNQPNILWLVGENMDLDLGIYGAENVYTPNLDSLAALGTRYTNVFSTSPVCAPSRSAFMVGHYATTTDMHHMRSHRTDGYRLPDGMRPITHRMNDVGYHTANIKWIDEMEVGTAKLDLNFAEEGDVYNTNDWSTLQDNEPFFAQINMPESEYDIYDRETYKHDRVEWYGEEMHPQIANVDNVNPPPYYPDHPLVRKEWASYLNSVSGMDIRIGWILKRLRDEGLADNTIIVFFGDNGRMEPRGIHWLWDSGIHVPMFIYYPPGMDAPPQFERGKVIDDVISLLDITATTLWLAGVDKPEGMQSRNILGDNPDPERTYAFSARDRIDETVLRMRSVRAKDYHYIRNYSEGEGFATLNRYKEKCFAIKPLMRKLLAEDKLVGPAKELMMPMPYESLYNTADDPYEIVNLATSDNPADQEALVAMRSALDEWQERTGDRGHIAEPDSVVAVFEPEMDAWFGTPEWAKE